MTPGDASTSGGVSNTGEPSTSANASNAGGPTGSTPDPLWQRTVLRREQRDESERPPGKPSPGGRFAIVALLLLLASQTTRWGWTVDSWGHTTDVGFLGQSTSGLAGSIAALALVLAIRSHSGASSGFRVVQYLPLILGAACLLIVLGGYSQAYAEMAGLRANGQPADLDLGVWLALTGGALALVSGTLATRSRRRNPVHLDAGTSTLSDEDRRALTQPVPMERLHEQGPNR